MRLTKSEYRAILKKTKQRALKRAEKRVILRQAGLFEGESTNATLDNKNGLKRKYVRKSTRRRLVAQLDIIFSLYIRMRDKRLRGRCPFHDSCSFRPIECCFHFITRSKFSTRWDEQNAVGACHACNFKENFNNHIFISWYLSKFGKEQYESLIARSNRIAKHSIDDLERMKSYFKAKLELHE